MSRSLYRYQSVRQEATALVMRIREIANTRVHYGYRRVHVMLKREGWQDNVKRVYRLYQEQGLSLRMKRPKRNKSARLRQPKHVVTAMNQIWSMDFVADALFDGRKLRALTVRRLPRQVDKLKVEISALISLGRYASGVFLPRDS
jgi:putative transposase